MQVWLEEHVCESFHRIFVEVSNQPAVCVVDRYVRANDVMVAIHVVQQLSARIDFLRKLLTCVRELRIGERQIRAIRRLCTLVDHAA
ncbi:hypothetical protein D3C71_2098630 [compost metagenome]